MRRLEQALALSLDTVQSVVERLESKFGHQFLGPELQPLTTAEKDSTLEDLVESIDRSLEAGDKPEAARQFRDAVGCTWDHAHHAIGQWRYHSRDQRLRWLRLARYIKTLETAGQQ